MSDLTFPGLNSGQARILLECANEPSFFLVGSNIIDCNAMACEWLECVSEDLIGSSLLRWSSQLQAGSDPSGLLMEVHCNAAFQDGFVRFPWVFLRSDGLDLFCGVAMRAVTLEDGRRGLYCTVQDASQLKREFDQKERHINRFRVMFDASPIPFWLVQGNMFIGCNRAAAQVLGYSSRRELLNKHPSDLSPPRQPDGMDSYTKANLMGKLAFKNGLHRFEWLHRRANGEEFHAEVILTPIEIDMGPVMLGAWRDISEQKQREQAMRLAVAELESHLERIKDAMRVIEPLSGEASGTSASNPRRPG